MNIGLFGGSFNPPHFGHVFAAHMALARYDIDQCWVLPVVDHPYAKDLAPLADRLAWCRLAFAQLSNVVIKTDECDNPGGRTATLFDLLESRHPEHTFFLLGGSDTKADIANWYRGEELQRRLPILVIPRGGFDDNPYALPAISSSVVRDCLQQGEAIDHLVPRQVIASLASRTDSSETP